MKRMPMKLIAVLVTLGTAVVAPTQETTWKDPGVVMDQVEFKDAKISEIADYLRTACKDKMDVIVPQQYASILVSLRLKSVTATESFHAMNQLFEAGQYIVRWKLTMSGKRSTAILTELVHAPSDATGRTVLYIGHLVGDKKDGGLSLREVVDSIEQVARTGGVVSRGFQLQVHEATQLLVVRGTPEEIQFVLKTIEKLEQRKAVVGMRNANTAPSVESAKP